jgi:hypothetical protein
MKYAQKIRYKRRKVKIKCGNCRKSLKLSGLDDMSGKRHAHCKGCRLEWHLTAEGRKYSHPYKTKKDHKKENVVVAE